MTSSPSDPVFESVFEACLDAIERDGTAALELACARHPELAEQLRRRVGLLVSANLLDFGPSVDRLPAQLGDFEPGERLGIGGMGVVHRARQVSTGREVALKLVRPELLAFPESRARFRREVELSSRLHHPAILPAIAVGETDGLPWFAMELVRGGSLADLLGALRDTFGSIDRLDPALLPEIVAGLAPASLREAPAFAPPVSWRHWVLRAVRDVAQALVHAHQKGVLHRDLKPSNILVGHDGRLYLTDFGLASDPTGGSMTRPQSAVGSLPYMPPEVLEGNPADTRSDVYGLGAVLYELLTLQRPFGDGTAALLVRRILAGELVPLRRVARGLSTDDEAVALRALERDPTRRYASAQEFALDLDNLLARRPTLARPAGPGLRLLRLVQRRPAASIAVLLAALLLLGTPNVVWWQELQARYRLQLANTDLQHALQRERTERARADDNLERTARAVEVLLQETGKSLLDRVPLMQRVRRVLLENAQAVLEELLPQAPDAPRTVLLAAAVELSTADVRLEMGDAAAARALLQRGIERLRDCPACTAEDPARALELHTRLLRTLATLEERFDSDLAERLNRDALALSGDAPPRVVEERLLARLALHGLLQRSRRLDQASEVLTQASVDLESLVGKLADERIAALRSKLLNMRGWQSFRAGKLTQAGVDFNAAVAALEQILAQDPEAYWAVADAVSAGINEGAMLLQRGEAEQAEPVFLRARARAEQLVRLFPLVQSFRVEFAGLLVNLGIVRDLRGDADGCREAWLDAAEQGRALAQAESPTPEALRQAGIALSNLAARWRDEQRFAEAIAVAGEAEPILTKVLALTPGDPEAARHLQFAFLNRGLAAAEVGQREVAQQAMQAAADIAPAQPLAHRAMVDGWLALAKGADGAEREVMLDRALAALVRAFELGWTDADDLQRNTQLAPLRGRPGYPGH